MKFADSMLREFVETSLSAAEIGRLLTMASFELEGIDEVEGEPVLDIKVVSNRGDGLSVFGLAREILAKDSHARPTELYRRSMDRFSDIARAAGEAGASAPGVTIESDACTRYACRVFSGVRNGTSPEWLQRRIRQAGWRPISLLVDLTNYVMLELGQPLHAFDLSKLRGGRIVVREAGPGERLTTLDGVEHELNPSQMMICDAEGPVAVAGVMGGAETEIGEATTDVLLESAHFVNTSVRRTRKEVGLSTEASYRFERSVDAEGVLAALWRFSELLAQGGGGTALPGAVDAYPRPPKPVGIDVRMSRVTRLLGMEVTAQEARGYLERLGFQVTGDGEPFGVVAPTWRPDIVREDDVVEEVGRIHGYDRIPETPLHGITVQGGTSGFEARMDLLREGFVRAGFTQIVSHSLRDLHDLDRPSDSRIGPRNAGSPETAYLRNSHLPCLAEAVMRNGGSDLHLFEMGSIFDGCAAPNERPSGAVWSHGNLVPRHSAGETLQRADFFTLKASLEIAFALAGVQLEFAPPQTLDARFHPTRQATLRWEGISIGVAGQIHPDTAEAIGVPEDSCLAEFDLGEVLAAPQPTPSFRPLSRNPAVRRDLAVLIAKSIPFSSIDQAVRAAAGETLEKLWLFDVYEGQGIPEGSHSLAIAIQLRKFGQNFTDEEANQVRDRVAEALAALGGKLR